MAKTGRPLGINKKLSNGNTVGEQIVMSVAAGNYFEQACAAAGIAKTTGHRWLREGSMASQRVESAGSFTKAGVTGNSRAYYDFWVDVTSAEARWEVTAVTSLEIAARGATRDSTGNLRGPSKTTVTAKHDRDGNMIETVTRTEYLPPDTAVTMWRLERKFPDRYGRKVEIASAVPDPLTREDRFDVLGDKIEAYLEGRADAESDARND